MTTKQENTFSMWTVVKNYLAANESIWFPITAFNDAFQRLLIIIANVNEHATTQSLKTTGTTTNKKMATNVLISEAVTISGLVQSLANDTKNQELFNDMSYPKYKLQRLPDTNLPIKAQLIHDTAFANKTALENYGLSDEQLALFQTQITQYNEILTTPRNRQVAIKEATAKLAAYIREGNNELKNIDRIMGNFKTTNKIFYDSYFLSREIIDLGSTTTIIKIQVLNNNTNAFIPNAKITNSINDTELITDIKGANRSRIPFGTYNFTCIAEGFETQTLNAIKIKLGKTQYLKFKLTQS